jgi:hypothetical protein
MSTRQTQPPQKLAPRGIRANVDPWAAGSERELPPIPILSSESDVETAGIKVAWGTDGARQLPPAPGQRGLTRPAVAAAPRTGEPATVAAATASEAAPAASQPYYVILALLLPALVVIFWPRFGRGTLVARRPNLWRNR